MTEQQKHIDTIMRRIFPNDDGPGGAIIVLKAGEVFFEAAYGLADIEHGVKNTPDTVFKIASVTKEFTATAVLMLIHQGKVDLQDPISKHVPCFPHEHGITVEHLLTHTSGIIDNWDCSHQEDKTLQQMIDMFKDQPLGFKPGTNQYYSNAGFKLLGAMIENVSGLKYGEFIESQIFKPLKMHSSNFDNTSKIIKHRARGYCGSGDEFFNADFYAMTLPHAAGSLVSTVRDMAKFNQALYTDELVPQALLQQAWTEHEMKEGFHTFGGYGWCLSYYKGRKMIGGGGCISGFRCMDLWSPQEKVFAMVLSNQEFHRTIPEAMKAAAIAMGDPVEEPPTIQLSEQQLSAYAGKYHFEDIKKKIVVGDGVLKTTDMFGHVVELRPYTKDRFIFPGDSHDMIFERDDDGQVITAIIEAREGFLGSDRGSRIEDTA